MICNNKEPLGSFSYAILGDYMNFGFVIDPDIRILLNPTKSNSCGKSLSI